LTLTRCRPASSAVTIAVVGFLDVGGFNQTIGSLAGAGTVTNNGIASPATLTEGGNNASTLFSGTIQNGSSATALTKIGTGVLRLSGANTYTGATNINAGTLDVTGSIATSTLTSVNNGATLNGAGMVGNTQINAGGTFAPGTANVPGTSMTVAGNLAFQPGSVYEVEVNAAGQGDQVIVNGAVNLTGSILSVLAANGTYQPSTSYLIIDNDDVDPVIGTFASVTTNLAFLTPSVVYNGGTGNDVVLTLVSNIGPGPGQLSFCSVAETPNQCNVANALDLFPTDNTLFLAVLSQSAEGVHQPPKDCLAHIAAVVGKHARNRGVNFSRQGIEGLPCEASYTKGNGQVASLGAGSPQVASLDSQAMTLGYDDKALGSSLPSYGPGLAFWTRAYGAWADFDGNKNAASANRNLGGFVTGMDAQVGGSWRLGLATGFSQSNINVDARFSSANERAITSPVNARPSIR
jgi:autotransporter-associated beta strand protein